MTNFEYLYQMELNTGLSVVQQFDIIRAVAVKWGLIFFIILYRS